MNAKNTKDQAFARYVASVLSLKLFESHYNTNNLAEFCHRALNYGYRVHHYFSPDTRRYFGSRVIDYSTGCWGLAFGVVETVQHPSQGRIIRVVVFNLLGDCTRYPRDNSDATECYASTKQARKALADILNGMQTQALGKELLAKRKDELVRGLERFKLKFVPKNYE